MSQPTEGGAHKGIDRARSERSLYALVVGQIVKHLREAHASMSQGALARLSGLGKSTVSRIEQGQLAPRLYSLRTIAAALGMSAGDFLEIIEAAHARGFALVQDGTPAPEAARIVAGQAFPRSRDLPEAAALRRFEAAVALLREIGSGYRLYVASSTLCLLSGESHDEHGAPRRDRILADASGLWISGGDW